MKEFLFTSTLYIVSLIVPFYIRDAGWNWFNGWCYVLPVLPIKLATPLFVDKTLIEERGNAMTDSTTKVWDKYIVAVFSILWLFIPTMYAFEARLKTEESPPNRMIVLTAASIACLANLFGIWAMISNQWFSSLVRIQKDRKHRICDRGPYAFVRHPAYIALIVYALCQPFILLDSDYFTLSSVNVLSAFCSMLFILRTKWEDATLMVELDGYEKYAHTVKYRLLPGVW